MLDINFLSDYLNLYFEEQLQFEKTLGVMYILSYILNLELVLIPSMDSKHLLFLNENYKYLDIFEEVIEMCQLSVIIVDRDFGNGIYIHRGSINGQDMIKLPSVTDLNNLGEYLNVK